MKKTFKPSSAKALSENGKPLHGTAAQLRLTSLAGGWDKHQRELMTSAATEAVNQLWLKVVTNYTLVPYRETQAQGQGAHSRTAQSRTCEIPSSANFTSSSSSHGRH
ncbi:MAG: hypothetical protein U1E02_23815 [Hydrogenophaga sp.]|uniref:hypothetical protein n=1 Tax=Hydrogenophaga sp. TaxID=1904254 RepID=UPI00272103C1|nr:hypothetical protein [Hydrogenophaga sp.]MDO8889745.1 hypothetical protein [Hydrogenophaga sp.]MDP2251921.1 hypothetical protein [Hydrogenophaga sp.]MDZ4127164.1 hypothetical protein [Hydrogenophaga sp.]